MSEEIKGDNQDKTPEQFNECVRLKDDKDLHCKYMDNNNKCIFENCLYAHEETPTTVLQWWFTCIICKRPDAIMPKDMKIHWCQSCINRANEAEVLPFQCRYCGSYQNKPSEWMFSRVCDKCVDKFLYQPRCKNYWCRGAQHQV